MKFSVFVAAAAAAQVSLTIARADKSGDPVNLEHVVISAAPLERDQTRLAMATTVLGERAMAERLQPTLGETLALLPGVSSTYFGPGASRPVIRGLGGDRIRILQNSIGTIDASVVSPDHAVAMDPLLIERIEIVRGPAALLYGGNAIGGVVNVIDHRIHHRSIEGWLHGRAEARVSSVDSGDSQAALVEGSAGPLSWHVDGYRRSTGDVDIPGFALTSALHAEAQEEAEEEGELFSAAHGSLPNSATRSDGAAAGLSLGGARGFLGASFSGHNSLYGIPPGAHDHHGEVVRIDLRQRRVDLQGELKDPLPGFTLAKLKLGLARYRHQELEGDEVGTVFHNRGHDSRLELVQERVGGLNGAVGLQSSRSKFSAQGEEAFLPASKTRQHGLFAFEEIAQGPVTYQLGGRVDQQRISVMDTAVGRRDTAFSGSAGVIWTLDGKWSLSGTLARNERAPNVQELFADGPHVGTQSYERGSAALRRERSVAVEAVLRRRAGFVTGEVSLFAHRFSGYIFAERTGEIDPDSELEVFRYAQNDADFYGAELDLLLHLHESGPHALDLQLTADFVRAKERASGTALPRIAPRRLTAAVRYRSGRLTASVSGIGVERARHLAPDETPTPGYVWLNAQVSYAFERGGGAWSVFLRGENLADKMARNHVSFLKDIAPLPGRNLSAGVQLAF